MASFLGEVLFLHPVDEKLSSPSACLNDALGYECVSGPVCLQASVKSP